MVEVVSGNAEEEGSKAGEAGPNGDGAAAGASTDTLVSTGGTSTLVYAGVGVGTLALGALLARRLIGS